jgi:hypothetical protein
VVWSRASARIARGSAGAMASLSPPARAKHSRATSFICSGALVPGPAANDDGEDEGPHRDAMFNRFALEVSEHVGRQLDKRFRPWHIYGTSVAIRQRRTSSGDRPELPNSFAGVRSSPPKLPLFCSPS